MKIGTPPKVGWGILTPDPEISPETLELVKKLSELPPGQRDALLTRAVPRYLDVEMNLGDQKPTLTDMVDCSSGIANFFLDIVGKP